MAYGLRLLKSRLYRPGTLDKREGDLLAARWPVVTGNVTHTHTHVHTYHANESLLGIIYLDK